GVLEDDVGDAGGDAAAARGGADAEALGRGVRRLADGVLRAGVTDDGVLDAVAVDDGGDRAAGDPVIPVVPDAASGGDDDEWQGIGAQVAAVRLLEGCRRLEPRVGGAVAARARPAVAVDVHVGLPVHRAVHAADGDDGGGVGVAAVEVPRHPDAATHAGQQVGGGHGTFTPLYGLLRVGQGGQRDRDQQGGAGGGERQRADTHDKEPSPGRH
ncbi:hypothetical protein STRIP9103_00453, partial [Streptomyces ipomoeae 91-03]